MLSKIIIMGNETNGGLENITSGYCEEQLRKTD